MKRRYVIQAHSAKRAGLHYDFRVEWDGELKTYHKKRPSSNEPHGTPAPTVLRSWCIPKARLPWFNEKLLAIPVEDHPIEYISFEGTIEDGYGAGEVKIVASGECYVRTDRGTVTVELKRGTYKLIPFKKNYLITRVG